MKVVSVIPESFQEYPDHISAVMFFFGCNFKCSYCYNYDIISDITKVLPESPEALLDRAVSPLTDGLVLLGGEPTIYRNKLLDFASYAKKKYSLDIKLFTNGSNPDILIQGIKHGLIDHASIDFKFVYSSHPTTHFKTDSLSPFNYLGRMLLLLNRLYILGVSDRVEIRTTIFNGLENEEVDIIQEICNTLNMKHIIQLDVSDSYKKLGVI